MYIFNDKKQNQVDSKLCTPSYLATTDIKILTGLKPPLIKTTLLQDCHTSVHGLIQHSASSYLVVASGSKQDVSVYFHGSFLSEIFSLHDPNLLES